MTLPTGTPMPTRRLLREQRSASSGRLTGRRRGERRARRLAAKLTSLAAMLGVGALLVATSVPANAFMQPAGAEQQSVASEQAGHPQQLDVAQEAVADQPARDTYTVQTLAQKLKAQFFTRDWSYAPKAIGPVRWPFPVAVPITSGFGPRLVTGCGFCSTYHYGVDFAPGAGTPIGVIADGVVTEAGTTGPFGNHVIIQHVVDGQRVQSLYAHMLSGTIAVAVGQQVQVGGILGQVGATGDATGPHLHLEVHLDGTPVDPFAWLKANTA